MLGRRSIYRVVPLAALCALLSCVIEPAAEVPIDLNAPVGEDGTPEIGGVGGNQTIRIYTDKERAEKPRVRASFFKVNHSPEPTPTATPDNTPRITSFSPAKGKVGEVVTINGVNFDPDKTKNQVLFKTDVAATVATASATVLQVKVPSGAADGPISLKIGSLTATSAGSFDVEEALSITSFTPASAAVGAAVKITGTGFSTDKTKNKIRFKSVSPVDAATASATVLEVLVPTGAASGPIGVEVEGAVATSTASLTIK